MAYETPVLGYPWSIPFEFPLYQTIVAFVSSITNVSIDRVGRLLSFAFLLACAWPALQVTRRLNWSSDVAWVFCALLWSSPFYLFYGRMFLMETAALFFAMTAVPFGLDLKDSPPRWRSVLLFCVFSTLALLQKSTTGLPVIIALRVVLFVLVLATTRWRKLSYQHYNHHWPIVFNSTNYRRNMNSVCKLHKSTKFLWRCNHLQFTMEVLYRHN